MLTSGIQSPAPLAYSQAKRSCTHLLVKLSAISCQRSAKIILSKNSSSFQGEAWRGSHSFWTPPRSSPKRGGGIKKLSTVSVQQKYFNTLVLYKVYSISNIKFYLGSSYLSPSGGGRGRHTGVQNLSHPLPPPAGDKVNALLRLNQVSFKVKLTAPAES